MGTVYGKNTTSSSITVAGHKVYYIDSTDAEIVEVEKQGGGGSTASDDATGTIAGVSLPSAHSYTGVSFDSLRYYVKGTISNTGQTSYAYGLWDTFFYGTITWEDSSLGDLTDKITTNSPSNDYRVKQTVFRIIFITSNSITGYHPWDDGDDSGATNNNQISDYSYNNGVHSITFWADGVNWIGGSVYLGRIQFRYLDETTTFTGLNAFDLVNVSDGALSKATTTDRYDMYNVWGGDITLHALYGSSETIRRNAFKYLLSGTPYWYVIDGEHDTWTNDLREWGYSEVQPAETLPTVTTEGDFASYNWLRVSSAESVSGGGNTSNLTTDGTDYPNYNTGNSYAILQWQQSGGTTSGRVEFSIVNANGKIQAHNNTSGALTFYQARVAVCSSNQATVVTVYDSSNNAYNAFKFTANNTDYYYVLDGTQTDWTDDLSGIGYSLTPNYLKGYINSSKSNSYVSRYSEKNLYDDAGNLIIGDSSKTYTIIGVYTANDGSVSYQNASLYAYDNRLKFAWNDSDAYIAYVEYTVL